MSKISMLAAGAVGYVLGTRAGRERYQQIVAQAQRVWSNPKMQRATSEAREKAPEVSEKLTGAAKKAANSVSSSGSGSQESTDSSPAAATSPVVTPTTPTTPVTPTTPTTPVTPTTTPVTPVTPSPTTAPGSLPTQGQGTI